MNKKLLMSVVALFVFTLPIVAVVSGRPLDKMLKDLATELRTAYMQRGEEQRSFNIEYNGQHRRMLDIVTTSNELSMLLYTQEQEMTFDLAYALKKVTAKYNDFSEDKHQYNNILKGLDIEVERYSQLIENLQRLPKMKGIKIDKTTEAYRDSCIRYATVLMRMHARNRAVIMADSTHYQKAFLSLQETYNYAQTRYKNLENYVFVEGQTPFLNILNDPNYWEETKADIHRQYSLHEMANTAQVAEEGADEATFFGSLTSRAENTMLVIVCILQFFMLGVTWLATFLVIWFICRFTRVKKYIPKKKRAILSVLIGTIVYFLVFGFFWNGDEYIVLGARHVNTALWLLIAISGSLLLRVKPEQFRQGFQLYSPTFLIVLVIIACRITFVPDKLMVMLFPPILLLVVLRQLFFCIWLRGKATSIDSALGWVSLGVYFISFVISFIGYTFVALLILVWWYFLVALWLTVVCVSDLLNLLKTKWLDKRVAAMRKRITYVSGEDRESLLFGATWFYDLVRQVLLPTIVLLSLPLCLSLSLSIFDFDNLFVDYYVKPFIQLHDQSGHEVLKISGRSIIYLLILFYVMRYANRAIHTIWQYLRYTTFMRKHKRTTVRVNEINLSLGNSIISVLVWMAYALVVIYVWRIPTGSLGLIAGGLSAGIGLALKDVINNFIYGIQLMGGRLRVGDWIECEGIRGKVTSINYQCVQAETVEGTEMSFLNSSLFGKNFNNLTRNNSYELTKITVGVAYGTDVQHVREVLVKAMQKMRTKDRYGREIVDPKYGINVVVSNMSDSAVDIAVKQYVLVAEQIGYVDRSKEVIYDALNEAGITIAFPQCDVHLIKD